MLPRRLLALRRVTAVHHSPSFSLPSIYRGFSTGAGGDRPQPVEGKNEATSFFESAKVAQYPMLDKQTRSMLANVNLITPGAWEEDKFTEGCVYAFRSVLELCEKLSKSGKCDVKALADLVEPDLAEKLMGSGEGSWFTDDVKTDVRSWSWLDSKPPLVVNMRNGSGLFGGLFRREPPKMVVTVFFEVKEENRIDDGCWHVWRTYTVDFARSLALPGSGTENGPWMIRDIDKGRWKKPSS
eukprot:TRINITY_DN115481_c0_g1_i1.p1 TRINITY_DN115481_c0_g1~~TRINITY_DN115481_c0_g1_i1.p1  ORF type:complete len:240 (+),score=37.52 TRINITY_DN115481_c0_g1_i1:35-754(+)